MPPLQKAVVQAVLGAQQCGPQAVPLSQQWPSLVQTEPAAQQVVPQATPLAQQWPTPSVTFRHSPPLQQSASTLQSSPLPLHPCRQTWPAQMPKQQSSATWHEVPVTPRQTHWPVLSGQAVKPTLHG